MPTIGYVAITIGVLGAIATFSGAATAFAIILALPALILCTKAHRIYKSRFQKASGALAVLLVLNWIGTIVSGLCLLVVGIIICRYNFENRNVTAGPNTTVPGVHDNTATPPFRSTPQKIWARGLNASATELSPEDVSRAETIFKQCSEMLSAEIQIMKAWGTGVGSEDAFKRDAPGLLRAWTSALATAAYYQAAIADPGQKPF
jgi:hypothetical protein